MIQVLQKGIIGLLQGAVSLWPSTNVGKYDDANLITAKVGTLGK